MKAAHDRARSLLGSLMGARSSLDKDPGYKPALRVLELASALRAVAGLLEADEYEYRRRCFDTANKASYLAGLILDESINDLVILRLREAQEPLPNLEQLEEEANPKGSDLSFENFQGKKRTNVSIVLEDVIRHGDWTTSNEVRERTGLTLQQVMVSLSHLRNQNLVRFKPCDDPKRGKHNALLHAPKL